ncbi:halocarboxylic acid dehydrogenase DehI family protein [Aquibacillus kalidii]|uniref:halocarboxylic acid dehydrogenase DehI family protein n=1 Tax=Aquibacillus kalidii TaxID=2762597 RepID=UPI00164636DF|nr:halocarboxylic acid dehydrogenase DehI family protein [Aquibacillus kalidii]
MRRIEYGIPEILEQEAFGHLHCLYTDIKYVLKVPIVNFIFRALAPYQTFLHIAWHQVRPNMLTTTMEREAEVLRYPDISFHPNTIKKWSDVYSAQTLDHLQKIIFTFNYVNPKLLLIATAWEEALSHRQIKGTSKAESYIKPGIIQGLPNIPLLQVSDAPDSIRELLMDIKNTEHTYDVASDFRALAYYPDFLEVAWKATKPFIGSEEYVLKKNNLVNQARKAVSRMPYPVLITPEHLRYHYPGHDIAGIMGLINMFKHFIAGLLIDLECFRRILNM